jgi:hypothetical protein
MTRSGQAGTIPRVEPLKRKRRLLLRWAAPSGKSKTRSRSKSVPFPPDPRHGPTEPAGRAGLPGGAADSGRGAVHRARHAPFHRPTTPGPDRAGTTVRPGVMPQPRRRRTQGRLVKSGLSIGTGGGRLAPCPSLPIRRKSPGNRQIYGTTIPYPRPTGLKSRRAARYQAGVKIWSTNAHIAPGAPSGPGGAGRLDAPDPDPADVRRDGAPETGPPWPPRGRAGPSSIAGGNIS